MFSGRKRSKNKCACGKECGCAQGKGMHTILLTDAERKGLRLGIIFGAPNPWPDEITSAMEKLRPEDKNTW